MIDQDIANSRVLNKSVGPEILDLDIVSEDFVGLDSYLGGLN